MTPLKKAEAAASDVVFKDVGRKKKAYEEVVNQIREEIFSGGLRLNQRLPTERNMADQFGVSRVVIREAIRALELTGFVTVKKGAGGGTFVAQDFERPIEDSLANLLAGGEVSLENLFEVRITIESVAAARAAERGTDEEFAVLQALIDEAVEESAKGTNIRPYNIRFHRLILRMAHNPLLSLIGETVLSILSRNISSLVSPETSLKVLESHQALTQAITNRNSDLARKLAAKEIESLGVLFSQISRGGQ
ncbi:MAG: FadR family transcriptional regulator [Deltaproteobacteria bacterium]|nr:FadR family transcriptional regulator [Deltaproteobacteria bacterium]